MVEVALDRPPQPAVYLLGVGQGARELEAIARVTRGLAQGGRAQLLGGTEIPSNAWGARVGPHGKGMPYPCVSFNPVWRELRECGSPLLAKATPASSRPHTFPPWTQRPAGMRAARWTGQRETAPAIPFLNPDPVAHQLDDPMRPRWL